MARFHRLADHWPAEFIRACDGDTIVVRLDMGLGVHVDRAVRLVAVESWEPRGETAERAREAAARVDTLCRGKPLLVRPSTRGLDCYGRVRGSVLVEGRDLAAELIARGISWPIYQPRPDHTRANE